MDRSVTFRAGASDAGNTLGVFLRQRGVSRHILTILKRTPEGILLNGEAAFTSRTLSAGDHVTIFVKEAEPPSPVAALPLPFPVIYEDEDLLVVDKPSGMAIHPSQGHHDNTLANAAAWYFQQKGESFVFRCINRLDRDTTGLLILAKNALSASILSAMLQKRQIGRTYLAAVEGDLPESGVIDAPIGRVPGSLIERRVDPEGGDAARTRYRCLLCRQLPLPGGGQQTCSLAAIRLETGRTHQIRVHMKSIGHPLAGDTLYHPETRLLPRQGLHSCALDFPHPITGEMMHFFSPLPGDMAALFPGAAGSAGEIPEVI